MMPIKIRHRYNGRVLLEAPGVRLSGADFTFEDLGEADISGSDLSGADFSRAYLKGATLAHSNLSGARLENASLIWTDFSKSNLTGTCLDPDARTNEEGDFDSDKDQLIGFRTINQRCMYGPDYRIGQTYTAPWFSVSSDKCHPGLYVCRSIADARKYGERLIEVRFQRENNLHHALGRYRVREFFVVRELTS